jgi:tetratricopeptide (TPR) repeat protein
MRKFYFLFLIVFFLGNFVTAQTEGVYQVALEEMNKKNYSLAIENFTKTLELLKNNSDVYYNRGLCYSELKEI